MARPNLIQLLNEAQKSQDHEKMRDIASTLLGSSPPYPHQLRKRAEQILASTQAPASERAGASGRSDQYHERLQGSEAAPPLDETQDSQEAVEGLNPREAAASPFLNKRCDNGFYYSNNHDDSIAILGLDDANGMEIGWSPACDLALVAHLESMRARGASKLLISEADTWSLTGYPDFHRHLKRHSTHVDQQEGAGVIYSLSSNRGQTRFTSPLEALSDLINRLGRPAQILNLTGRNLGSELFEDAMVFAPPQGCTIEPTLALPYIDSSIDIVAVSSPPPSLQAEARRIATLAVVHCADEPTIEWLREPPTSRLPSVSIIVPVFNQWPITKGCLQALWSTLPWDCEIEVIVSDDASTDETPLELASMAESEQRLKVLRNETNSGFVGSCNRAATAATGEVLVFLNNDTVPLPGWLEPLLRTFNLFPKVGAVGGKMLFPDGRLQEAGGIIFSDASACHFGRNEANAMGTLFNHVRTVDYVSGALLATPRSLFTNSGGFDSEFAPGYYEDTDYCFRLRERGLNVYYQPEAAVVHLEGGTAGTDPEAGMKRYQAINQKRFQARHAAALVEQRQRPESINSASWLELAHRGRGRVNP